VHLALDAPAPLHCKLDEHGAGWLSRFLSPILSVAQAWDDEHFATRLTGRDATRREPVISKSGLEISLLNVFTYRHGRIDDPGGSIHGTSSGWGLGFAYRDMAGFRCDRATVPQATDPETGQHFPDLHRKAFSVFVDPIRLLGELYRHNSRP
jgi:hypothetical protein